MNWVTHPLVLRVSCWLLGAVMLFAAIPKVIDPPGFAQSVFAYGLLPMALVAPLALALPWLEMLAALGLAFGVARRSAAAIVLLLMLVFIGGLGINLAKGNPVDCGCFGASMAQKTKEQRLFDMKMAVLRDLGLALLALHTLMASKKRQE
ncbi:MAG: DoxX family membrane protein [Holophagaceae bacterium]|nr:DoxX family membrane protein [Holophagaceae bacterium]